MQQRQGSQSINIQTLKTACKGSKHAFTRLLNSLLLISFKYFCLNQPFSIVIFHVFPLFFVELLHRLERSSKVFGQEFFVDNGLWSFGREVQKVEKVGVNERLHEAHDLVDEGDRVYDVDLLQTTWMGVLEEERPSFFLMDAENFVPLFIRFRLSSGQISLVINILPKLVDGN